MNSLKVIFSLVLLGWILQAETPLVEATRVNQVTHLNNEGARFYAAHHFAEAEQSYRAALALNGSDELRGAVVQGNLGTLYKHLDRYEEAELAYSRALELRKKVLAPNRPEIAYALNNLADIYRIQGRYWEARNLTQAAVRSLEQSNPDDAELSVLLSNLGVIERSLRNPVAAEKLLREALGLAERSLGAQSRPVALALNNLAQVLEDAHNYTEAEELYRRAVLVLEKPGAIQSRDLAIVFSNLGRMQYRIGRFDDARQAETRALTLIEAAPQPNGVVRGEIFRNIGKIVYAQGSAADSLSYFERSLMFEEQALGDEHPSVAEILFDYSAAALKAGKKKLSTKLAKRAERLSARQNRHNPERLAVDVNALRDSR